MEWTLFERLDLDRLNPERLWMALDVETRAVAARALYAGDHDDPEAVLEADMAVAQAMRFRPASVRKLAADKRAGHLAKRVRPDNSLATALLLVLHVQERREMLEAFLGELEIPNEEGMIDPDHDLVAPDPAALSGAVEALAQRFPEADVEVYLASLVAMDEEVWGGLKAIAREKGGPEPA